MKSTRNGPLSSETIWPPTMANRKKGAMDANWVIRAGRVSACCMLSSRGTMMPWVTPETAPPAMLTRMFATSR